MSRVNRLTALAVLACAFILSLIVAISLPWFSAMDIVRIVGSEQVSKAGANQIRLGVWAACNYALDGDRECSAAGHGYTVQIIANGKPGDGDAFTTIGSAWTRGLAVHPVATAFTLVALALGFAPSLALTLIASVASLLAGLVTLIAFAIDVALLAYVRHKVGNLAGHENIDVDTAAGFWITLVSLVLSLAGGGLTLVGYKSQKSDSWNATSNNPMKLFDRFRK